MNALLLGDVQPDDEAVAQMRERGGTWACYQNMDLGHRQVGHLQFLQVGPDCTFKEPPENCPDSHLGIGWRYRLVGVVDLETGKVKEWPPCPDTSTK